MNASRDLTIRAYTSADRDTLAALVAAPGVVEQYDKFGGAGGVELMLGDPYTPHDSVRLAFMGAEPAGFAYAIFCPARRHAGQCCGVRSCRASAAAASAARSMTTWSDRCWRAARCTSW